MNMILSLQKMQAASALNDAFISSFSNVCSAESNVHTCGPVYTDPTNIV